jgi:hypothetical protein
MAKAPFDPVVARPGAVWTGRELVVVGLACAPGQYDDEGSCLVGTTLSVLERGAQSWSDAAPVPAGDAAGPFFLACAGDAVYVHPSVLTAAWRYDLDARRWDTLPPPPSPAALTGVGVWTGRGFLVGVSIRTPGTLARSTDGFLLAPTDANWRTIPDVVGLDGPAAWRSGFADTFGYEQSTRATLLQTYRPS